MPKIKIPASQESEDGGKTFARIAIFAPIEPLKSGIATYTTKLLNGLLKKRPDLTIDVYIDEGYQPMDFGSDKINFFNHTVFPQNNHLYNGAVLFQAGNNYEFHGYMLPYIRDYGGIVELHDVKISGIYANLIKRFSAHIKKFQLHQCIQLIMDYPELRFFLWYRFLRPLYDKDQYLDRHLYRKSLPVRKARLIIVRDNYPVHHFRLPGRKCRIITHGIDIKDLPDEFEKSKIRKRFSIKEDAFVLVSAGIINSIKKIDRVIEAIALVRDRLPGLLYVLAGQSVRGDASIESLITSLGLSDRVRITGWLSNEDWLDYITIADAGINLRSENLGEHSGPTTNFFERGKVMLISDFEQNRIYPDDFAIKIPDGDNDAGIIAEKIEWLYNNRDYITRGGRLAREFAVTELDFNEIIIKQYCSVMGLPEPS
jgi:glycosyltransferase involved in cell wall biosynthesis